jgi:hypothetical protein
MSDNIYSKTWINKYMKTLNTQVALGAITLSFSAYAAVTVVVNGSKSNLPIVN